jgi:hypothetical protein
MRSAAAVARMPRQTSAAPSSMWRTSFMVFCLCDRHAGLRTSLYQRKHDLSIGIPVSSHAHRTDETAQAPTLRALIVRTASTAGTCGEPVAVARKHRHASSPPVTSRYAEIATPTATGGACGSGCPGVPALRSPYSTARNFSSLAPRGEHRRRKFHSMLLGHRPADMRSPAPSSCCLGRHATAPAPRCGQNNTKLVGDCL